MVNPDKVRGLGEAIKMAQRTNKSYIYVRKKNSFGLSAGYAYSVADTSPNCISLFPTSVIGDYIQIPNFAGESCEFFKKINF